MKGYLKTFHAINQYTNRSGCCFPAVRSLMKDTGFSERTVRYHIKRLVQEGLLQKLRRNRPNGSQTSNVYNVLAKGLLQPFAKIVKTIHAGKARLSWKTWMEIIESKCKWVKGKIMSQLAKSDKKEVLAPPQAVFYEDNSNKDEVLEFDPSSKKVGLISIASILEGMNLKTKERVEVNV